MTRAKTTSVKGDGQAKYVLTRKVSSVSPSFATAVGSLTDVPCGGTELPLPRHGEGDSVHLSRPRQETCLC